MARRATAGQLPRLLWGATLLAVPADAVSTLTRQLGVPDPDSEVTLAVVRLLGVRHVGQAVVSMLSSRTRAAGFVRKAAAAVDVLHVASLPALAAVANPAQQRLIACDAPIEALIAYRQLRAGSK